MVTYREVQLRVREQDGFIPEIDWIANVVSEHGITTRRAVGRLNEEAHSRPCPPEKRAAVTDALRHFGVI